MKVKELKEAIKDIGFHNDINLKVTEDIYAFYIESKNKTLAIVSKSEKCLIGINYQNFSEQEEKLRQTLFDVIYEFAKTPLDERQEEKKYIIPLPHLTTSNGEQLFLTHQGNFFPSIRDKKLKQTWKEKDLIHIPEEYRDFAVEMEEEE